MEKVGYIKVYRQVTDSPIWKKPSTWVRIWLFLLTEVNYKTNGLPIGSCYITYDEIERMCVDVTKGQIDHFMRWARKEDMISTQQTPRGMVLSIVKYSQYQQEEANARNARRKRDAVSDAVSATDSDAEEIGATLPAENARGTREPIYNKEERNKEYITRANENSIDVYPYFLWAFLDLGWSPGQSDTIDGLHNWMRKILKEGGIHSADDAKQVIREFHTYWDTRRDEPGFKKKNWKTTLINSPSLPINKNKFKK